MKMYSNINGIMEYKVPRILWENFESVLLAQTKRYIVELANRLHVSEKELLKRVLPRNDSLKIIIQDSQAESNQCKAYVQHDQLTVFCKKPVAYQSEFCPVHRHKRMTIIDGTAPTPIQKIKDRNDMEPMWVQDQQVIRSDGSTMGHIYPSKQTIILFVMEEAE